MESRRKVAKAWLEKYVEQFMFNDIKACIGGKANFAAALILSTYCEILGGLLNGVFEVKGDQKFNNYKSFLDKMGYDKLSGKAYGLVRGGLTHQYFIRQESTVFMWGTSEGRKGIIMRDDIVEFHVVDFFQEFQGAYQRMKDGILTGEEKMLSNFERALSEETLPKEAQLGSTYELSSQNTSRSSP